ncbi:MAG TPA: polysaccharide deacetylase family protein [Kofleriaceae bacterium]
MLKAFAVKGVAVCALLAAWRLAPSGWFTPLALTIVLATIAFFTFAIASPRSQYFARVVNRLPTTAPVIALTFDDGPDPQFTPQILDVLATHGAKATFFVLGARAAQHPDVIARIHREGHAIGTHTQHHVLKFHFGSRRYVRREIEEAIDEVAKITGERPTLFRPPQGLRTPHFSSGWASFAIDQGLVCVTWTVRGLDSLATTANAIVRRIAPKLTAGAIVTLHDGTGLGGGRERAPTIAAVESLLATCAQRGLRCISLADPAAGCVRE